MLFITTDRNRSRNGFLKVVNCLREIDKIYKLWYFLLIIYNLFFFFLFNFFYAKKYAISILDFVVVNSLITLLVLANELAQIILFIFIYTYAPQQSPCCFDARLFNTTTLNHLNWKFRQDMNLFAIAFKCTSQFAHWVTCWLWSCPIVSTANITSTQFLLLSAAYFWAGHFYCWFSSFLDEYAEISM